MQELTNIEKKLLKIKVKPIIKKRSEISCSIDNQLANKISSTLNKIKGRIDTQLAQSGKLDSQEFIKFRLNRKSGEIPNFNIFNEIVEKNGLDIILLVDCSGSMREIDRKVRDITATIMKAMENCSFINFKVLAFSAYRRDFQSVIDIIKKPMESARIQADSEDLHDIHYLALDYAVSLIEKSENKKMIFMITDGYPEAYLDGSRIDDTTNQSLFSRSVINAKNKGIPVFALFYNHIPSVAPLMRKIFRGNLYESSNFDDISHKFVKELYKTVENLNKGRA